MDLIVPRKTSVQVLVKRALVMTSCQVTPKLKSRLLRYERRPKILQSSFKHHTQETTCKLRHSTLLQNRHSATEQRTEEVKFLKPAPLRTQLPALKRVSLPKLPVCKKSGFDASPALSTPRPWSPSSSRCEC